jgi:16S rRNA (guanine527-N7)-methyltransferase
MHLVESTAKKCAFLAHVAQMTDTAVDIHCNRIEESGVRESIEPDVVSARALAPLPRLLELAAPFFRPGTRGLFLKGRDAEREIEAAKAHWHFTCRLHPSLTAADSPIVEVTELSKAKKGKPR